MSLRSAAVPRACEPNRITRAPGAASASLRPASRDCAHEKDLQMQAFSEAAEGIRTLDLLHGKQYPHLAPHRITLQTSVFRTRAGPPQYPAFTGRPWGFPDPNRTESGRPPASRGSPSLRTRDGPECRLRRGAGASIDAPAVRPQQQRSGLHQRRLLPAHWDNQQPLVVLRPRWRAGGRVRPCFATGRHSGVELYRARRPTPTHVDRNT